MDDRFKSNKKKKNDKPRKVHDIFKDEEDLSKHVKGSSFLDKQNNQQNNSFKILRSGTIDELAKKEDLMKQLEESRRRYYARIKGGDTTIHRKTPVVSKEPKRISGRDNDVRMELLFDRPEEDGVYKYLDGDPCIIHVRIYNDTENEVTVTVYFYLECWVEFMHHYEWIWKTDPSTPQGSWRLAPDGHVTKQLRVPAQGTIIEPFYLKHFRFTAYKRESKIHRIQIADHPLPQEEIELAEGKYMRTIDRFLAKECTGLIDQGYPYQKYEDDKIQLPYWMEKSHYEQGILKVWYREEEGTGIRDGYSKRGLVLIEISLESSYVDYFDKNISSRNAAWFYIRQIIPPDDWVVPNKDVRLRTHRYRVRMRGSSNIQSSWISEKKCYDWSVFRPVFRVLEKGKEEEKVIMGWTRAIPKEIRIFPWQVEVEAENDDSFVFSIKDNDSFLVHNNKTRYLEIAQTFPYTLNDFDQFCRSIPEHSDAIVINRISFSGDYPAENNLAGLNVKYENEKDIRRIKAIRLKRYADNPYFLITGMHLAPICNYMMEAMIRSILKIDPVYNPDIEFLDYANFLFIPIMNPDAYRYGIREVAPASGQDPDTWWGVKYDSQEAKVMRSFVRYFQREENANFHTYINLQGDIAPRPGVYKVPGSTTPLKRVPPVWGNFSRKKHLDSKNVRAFINEISKIQRGELPYGYEYPSWSSEGKEYTNIRVASNNDNWFDLGEDYLVKPFIEDGFNFTYGIKMKYPDIAIYVDEDPEEYRFRVHKYVENTYQANQMGHQLLLALYHKIINPSSS